MKELLYKKSQAVAALNRVEGFEPMELARTIKQEGQEDQLYLDVKYRKLWFRLVHPLGKIVSRILNFNETMALAEARIYLDHKDDSENYVANAFSMKFRTDDPRFGDKFLEMAETAAVGRALSDAGFGVQFADVGESNDPNQVDAGIPVSMQYPDPGVMWNQNQEGMTASAATVPQKDGSQWPASVHGDTSGYGEPSMYGRGQEANPAFETASSYPGNPMMNQFYQQAQTQGNMVGSAHRQGSQPIPDSQSGNFPDASLSVEELVQRMSYEQAKAVVIGGKGKFGGKTMGQVAMESPGSLEYFASSYRGHNNLIPAAARVLLNQALPLAG